jgi:hypothetical protein
VQKSGAETGILKSSLEVGLEVTYAVTRIVMLALEANTEERVLLAKQIEWVRELCFSARIGPGLGYGIPNRRLQ